MSTNALAADTVSPAAERVARGRLLGKPGRARELLALLDAEEPEQSIGPLVEKLRAGSWPLQKNWAPRRKATACPHGDRPAHAFRLCHSCATVKWMAAHPKATRAARLRRTPDELAARRAKRRRALGLREDTSEDTMRALAGSRGWSVLSPEERADRGTKIRAGKLRAAAHRKMRAAAIKRARSVEPSRASNYRRLTLTLGEPVENTYEGDEG